MLASSKAECIGGSGAIVVEPDVVVETKSIMFMLE
jgi:hypothetical protein